MLSNIVSYSMKHNYIVDKTVRNGMMGCMSEQSQSSASLTGEDAGCQFPTGPGGQVCGRSVVRSGAPGRPSSYCDLDGHTRAKAFAARRRFELAAARSEPGEHPGPVDADVAAGERPVTDGRASFGVLLARFEDAAAQAQRTAAEQQAQLAQILAAATDVVRTVSDPDAAAFEAEQAHREASVRVAEAQTAQAAAERDARDACRQAQREAELRAQADTAAEAALAQTQTLRAQTADQLARLSAETQATVAEHQQRAETAATSEQAARQELEGVRAEAEQQVRTMRGELADATSAATRAQAEKAAADRAAELDRATVAQLRAQLDTERADHHREITEARREAHDERAALTRAHAEQLTAVLATLGHTTDTPPTQTPGPQSRRTRGKDEE